MVANAPRPASSSRLHDPVGRRAPSRLPRAAACARRCAVAGPARPLRWPAPCRRDRQPTTMIGERIRAVYGDRAVAPAATVALRPAPARRTPGGVRARSRTDTRTSPRPSRPRRRSRRYFAPVEIDGERYVDGGAHSPTNADLLAGRRLRHRRGGVADVDARRRCPWRRPGPVAGGGTASSNVRSCPPAGPACVVLVIEPTADDLEADGRRRSSALDGTPDAGGDPAGSRSAASLLADPLPAGEPHR